MIEITQQEAAQTAPIHQRQTFFQRPDRLHDPLFVIAPIFNPVRWRSRWKLFQDFAKHCEEAGAILYTIEAAFGERDHAITSQLTPHSIKLRTRNELWAKENMINIAVARLTQDYPDWKKVAWIDADTQFARGDWANETLHQLEHYDFVQMWSQIHDVTSNYEINWSNYSFMYCYMNDPEAFGCPATPGHGNHDGHYPTGDSGILPANPPRGRMGSPGLAWACTRKGWDTVGGLMDFCILGSADWYMANALVGRVDKVLASQQGNEIKKQFHPGYTRRIMEWQERAEALHKNVGLVSGLALHFFHGPRIDRGYGSRNNILRKYQFNPDTDLRRDSQGMWQLDERRIDIRDSVRKYFRLRNEDTP